MYATAKQRQSILCTPRIFRGLEAAVTSVLVLATLFLGFQSTGAADPVGTSDLAGTPPGSPLTDKDCQLALFARDALFQDQILGSLNLGVTVRSGTATLWGTVPNLALARRAEEKVRGVLGLAQVKNELRIAVDDEETAEFLTKPDRPEFKAQTKRKDRPIPVSRAEDSRPSANKAAAVSPTIMPPIRVPAGPQKTVSAFEPPMTQPVLRDSSRQPLVETLERLRRSNERFLPIRFEAQGGVVRLWGNAACSEDVFIFAQHVSHFPGVERVIVERSR
jgi:BON domain